jgi:hypothetical protein
VVLSQVTVAEQVQTTVRLTFRIVSSKTKVAELARAYIATQQDSLRFCNEARDESRCGVVVVDGGWRQV